LPSAKAYFAKTDQGEVVSFDIVGSVCDNDRRSIREEILSKDSAVPMKLIEIVKELKT
jgi:hypothetical protein